ncbi:MAG: hypothetical protein AAFR53_16860, partial [Pseudomonadota bacterium]
PPHRAAFLHVCPGYPDAMTAKRTDWKTEPFGSTTPILYHAAFSPEELSRIKAGLIPAAMEDKWFIFYEAPTLYLHRSWTGRGIFKVELAEDETGASVASAEVSTDAPHDPEYAARLLRYIVSRLLLGQDTPFPET